MEHKIPPPIVMVIVGLLMWLTAHWFPMEAWHFTDLQGAASAFWAVGALVAVAGVVEFRRAKTTVNPLNLDKSTQLVSGGIYRFTRNPMYLGMLLILVGWAIHLQHIGAWPWLIGFILFINRFQIEPEERAMTKLFGESYVDYCNSVRRWF
ncbi:protein-S-isoprenylcysteine methyltransferase [Pseudidiomarina aestuarii]|uniref:Protein-S-isoprenylcysteine methyltransferase n=1 Tax=Pseudidiomarina aestuarii TaxID=624146 RepID=A0A7Z6ZVY6_9GAMM|nr:isoprenylcysteine carboxylmethyltransferase family protein [Pseudidiomarina aestuarii]RUO42211.1 protein-S-isoprenylcysteine methyltransferase [Pseudidiomarina aestuarii]